MKRSSLLFFSVPPSPRTPSVTRIPRTLVGHTIPVGWNCVISMSMRSAPASSAMPWPSPVYSQEFDVIEPRVPVTAEVALQDEAVLRAVEERAPFLELENAIGRFLRVELRHPPVVQQLAAAHGVAEVDLPVVLLPYVAHR